MQYAIITENDSSEWNDKTGELYNFPSKYLKIIPTGTKVIYYKGKLKSKDKALFQGKRLSPEAHYFGIAEIGRIYPDLKSKKNDFYAEVKNFKQMLPPVIAKNKSGYYEEIPTSRVKNYWRDGVRPLSKKVYDLILKSAEITEDKDDEATNDLNQGLEISFQSGIEGSLKKIISTKYERNPALRQQAVNIHGYSCKGCGFNFTKFYGEWGNGFIHVHHLVALADSGETTVNPKDDMIVLCANCHSMVHRKRKKTLTIADLKRIIKDNGKWELS